MTVVPLKQKRIKQNRHLVYFKAENDRISHDTKSKQKKKKINFEPKVSSEKNFDVLILCFQISDQSA